MKSIETHEVCCISEIPCLVNSTELIRTNKMYFNNKKYGYSVWMDSDGINLNHISSYPRSYSKLYFNYASIKDGKDFLLACSSRYSDDEFEGPIGFNVENGNVINKKLNEDMDALVVVSSGKIRVVNKDEKFWWREFGEYIRILNSSQRIRLLNWAENSKASIFQTHLLAYNNEFKVSPVSNGKRAIRKFLTLVSDESGAMKIVLFYIKRPETLFEACNNIFGYLKSEGHFVHNMINLDTGANDVLELNNEFENCSNEVIRGRTPIEYAADLLVFCLK